MGAKFFKKALLVLAVVTLLTSAAFAAPAGSALVTDKTEVSQYTQAIPGGLEVTYNGLWKHGNILEAYYTVTSSRGGRVSAEAANSKLIDANDNNIPPVVEGSGSRTQWRYGEKLAARDRDYRGGNETVEAGTYINDKRQDALEFEANQPYKVAIRYWVPGEYVLTPIYKLITVVINGLPVEFKDASVGP